VHAAHIVRCTLHALQVRAAMCALLIDELDSAYALLVPRAREAGGAGRRRSGGDRGYHGPILQGSQSRGKCDIQRGNRGMHRDVPHDMRHNMPRDTNTT
jgi:hypothetical protein